MVEFVNSYFSVDGFMPHGHCYLWTPSLLWTYVVSDTLIAIAYFSIPIALIFLQKKRKDIPFNWVIILFAAFILSCGITHLLSIWTIWNPVYWLDATAKAFTALMSIFTAIALWQLMPRALLLPSHGYMKSLLEKLQHEMTERSTAEDARKQSDRLVMAGDERLRHALKACQVGAWDLDLIDNSTYRSLEYDNIFGYAAPHPNWTYEVLLEHVVPEDREAVDRQFKSAVISQSDLNFECRIQRVDGVVRWIWTVGQHVIDPVNDRQKMAGIVQDITERKINDALLANLNATLEQRVITRTEELEASNHRMSDEIKARQHAEERFRRVVEAAPSAMVMIGRRGSIEMVNTQAEKLFGYPREEMLSQSIEMLVPERFRHGHPEKRDQFFGGPQFRPMGAGRDLFAQRKEGSEFPVEISLNPIETVDGAMVLYSIVDITERRDREAKIETSLIEKDTLLGEIHHRVKNNLQIVDSFLALQASRVVDPAVRIILTDSQNRIRSMALIHQSLYQSKDFGRINFGIFLETLVPTLVSSYGLYSHNIQVILDVEPVFLTINAAIPCGLFVNEAVTNSLKHAFPNRREGKLTVRLALAQPGTVLLMVSDNGVGMAEDVDKDMSDTLGLSLLDLLSKQLLGTLTVMRNNPTTFSLTFPFSES